MGDFVIYFEAPLPTAGNCTGMFSHPLAALPIYPLIDGSIFSVEMRRLGIPKGVGGPDEIVKAYALLDLLNGLT